MSDAAAGAAARPTSLIVEGLKRAGIDLVASLPDKWLGDLIDTIAADAAFTHVRVTREDDGVGICAGAYLGGRKAALVCQNAGLLLALHVEPEPSPYPAAGRWSQVEERALFMRRLHGEE
jgi:hypothetical protein